MNKVLQIIWMNIYLFSTNFYSCQIQMKWWLLGVMPVCCCPILSLYLIMRPGDKTLLQICQEGQAKRAVMPFKHKSGWKKRQEHKEQEEFPQSSLNQTRLGCQPTDRLPPSCLSMPQQLCHCPQWRVSKHFQKETGVQLCWSFKTQKPAVVKLGDELTMFL